MSFSLARELEGAKAPKGSIWICTRRRAKYIFLPGQLLDKAWQEVSFHCHFAVAVERVGILLADV